MLLMHVMVIFTHNILDSDDVFLGNWTGPSTQHVFINVFGIYFVFVKF